MKPIILRAVIEASSSYGEKLNDKYVEYGENEAILMERLESAMKKIAPIADWLRLGNYLQTLEIDNPDGSRIRYTARSYRIDLVC